MDSKIKQSVRSDASSLTKPYFLSQIVFSDLTDIYGIRKAEAGKKDDNKAIFAEVKHPYTAGKASDKPIILRTRTAAL